MVSIDDDVDEGERGLKVVQYKSAIGGRLRKVEIVGGNPGVCVVYSHPFARLDGGLGLLSTSGFLMAPV